MKSNDDLTGSLSPTDNTSYSTSTITSDDEVIPGVFIDVLGVWITGALSLLGVAGNGLSFVVLQRTFGRSPMFYVLRIMSLSDSAFLLTVFMAQTAVNLHPITGLFEVCFLYRGYVQFTVWPVLMTTQMTTVWLTVLVSCERYVAICFPLKAAYICTISKVRVSVVLIGVVSVLFNIPR